MSSFKGKLLSSIPKDSLLGVRQRNGILNKHPQEILTTFRRNTISMMVDVGILKWDGVTGTGDGEVW